MIIGVGLDVCQISRMENLSDSRFLVRFFSKEEQEYIHSRGIPAQSMAGIYAAKEAYLKALKTGIVFLNLSEIVVMHDENGAPVYDLRGKAAELALQHGVKHAFLSISHDDGVAAAICVLEGDDALNQHGK